LIQLVSFHRHDYVSAMNDTTSFVREDPWRIFRIMSEFVDSFQTLSQVGPAVTIFGSVRTKPADKYYRAAQEIAKELAKHNLAVVTGGGGAGIACGQSCGFAGNILVPIAALIVMQSDYNAIMVTSWLLLLEKWRKIAWVV